MTRKATDPSSDIVPVWHQLGTSPSRHWLANKVTVDMSLPDLPQRRVEIASEPQNIICDLNKTALVVIDMQNDFCAEGGWVDSIGGNFAVDRLPIEPLRKLLPELRSHDVPIIWVNWGNRPDLLNMPANQIHLYTPDGQGTGLGDALPSNGAHVLEKDSWAAEVVEELSPDPSDIRVDKYRISGFWDTPLDSILKNLGIHTILFGGVNTDQCVFCSLTDANFLGYGCILVSDCCATTSPGFCTEATLWNVKNCFGFVCESKHIISALKYTE